MKYSLNDCIRLQQNIGDIPADVDVKVIKVHENEKSYDIATLDEPILMAANVPEEELDFAENI